jgi:hypothetical protein
MESPGQQPPSSDPEVPLGDAAIASQIAGAAARGRGADRAPTLEQLLAAFGEPAPTDAARRRVAAALRVAGMGVRPDLLSAETGQRLLLLPPGAAAGRPRWRAALGLAGVAAILVAAAAGASLLEGSGDDGGRVADSLPAGSSSAPAPSGGSASAPATATTATTATTPGTTPTETADTTPTPPTDTTATTTTPDDDEAAAAARRARRQAARRKREAAAKRRAAAARRTVTVRVDASARPSFLCVDDGGGTILFSGTLSDKKTFKSRRVRMNVGLASTIVTVNGNPVRLNGSPDGLDITRAGGAKTLPIGQRPCG